MNSLRLPRSSPSWVNGEAPAKTSIGTRPRAALCTAPASACVPQSTCTSTACGRPETWAKPWAALIATISFGQVTIAGHRPAGGAAAAIASTSAGWSLPKLAKTWLTPASTSASRKAVPVL